MKFIAVAFLVLIAIVQPAMAQTLTPPEAQATAEMARADANRASAQATSVSRLATANAPTATPPATSTPLPPTETPVPTATPDPTATATAEPTATMQPVAPAAPVVRDASEPTPTAPAKGRTIYDDWPLLLLLGIGALVMVVAAWRLIDGKTITLPGRNDK